MTRTLVIFALLAALACGQVTARADIYASPPGPWMPVLATGDGVHAGSSVAGGMRVAIPDGGGYGLVWLSFSIHLHGAADGELLTFQMTSGSSLSLKASIWPLPPGLTGSLATVVVVAYVPPAGPVEWVVNTAQEIIG